MTVKTPSKIQQKQVNYILKAIMNFVFLEELIKKPSQKARIVKKNAITFLLISKLVWPKMLNPP